MSPAAQIDGESGVVQKELHVIYNFEVLECIEPHPDILFSFIVFVDNGRYVHVQREHDVAETGEPDAKKGHDRRAVKSPCSP